jgi:glycine/D-amino acid oxidase-like deaminating enzyme
VGGAIDLDVRLDEARPSWWLEDALARENGPEPTPLAVDLEVDVAIVGGGYTGLWTALALQERGGGMGAVVLEAGLCGSQASGKNGGVVHGYWTGLHRLIAGVGRTAAAEVARAGSQAQDALRAFCEPRAEELWWRSAGAVKIATTPQQDSALGRVIAAARSLGRADQAVPLTAAQVQERCASPRYRGGVFFPEAATVHPARLARALREAVVCGGTPVYERTKVTTVRRENGGYVLVTQSGTVRASSVVLATNCGLTGLRAVRPHVTNFSSYAVMTEPIPHALESIGWTGGEGLLDSLMFLHYYRTTPDGRVLMGTGSGPVGYGSRLGDELTRDEDSMARAADGLRRLLPGLGEFAIDGAWGGPIDVSADHLPFFGPTGDPGVYQACGYSGHGVNATWLGGQALTSLLYGQRDEWTSSPFCTRKVPSLPPEPIRYLGGRMVRAGILACEEAEQQGSRAPLVARAVAALPRLLRLRIGTR